jgi:hypothetical protein
MDVTRGTFKLVLLKYATHWFLLYNSESILMQLHCHNSTYVLLLFSVLLLLLLIYMHICIIECFSYHPYVVEFVNCVYTVLVSPALTTFVELRVEYVLPFKN